jgi:chitinase
VNNSPQNGNGTGFAGTNFAAHCADTVYVKNDRNSLLLSGCDLIKRDIKICQQMGKKVLLSIGGEFSATSNYTVSSVTKGEEFADFMWNAFGPLKSGYTGPRPFDVSNTDPTCVDGFDFDIEKKFGK